MQLHSGIKREGVSFYFVWTKTGRVPRFAHGLENTACEEAQRLASKNPGKKFVVLKAIHKFSAVKDHEKNSKAFAEAA